MLIAISVQNALSYCEFILAGQAFFSPAFLLRVFTATDLRFRPILIKATSYTVDSIEVTRKRKPFQLFPYIFFNFYSVYPQPRVSESQPWEIMNKIFLKLVAQVCPHRLKCNGHIKNSVHFTKLIQSIQISFYPSILLLTVHFVIALKSSCGSTRSQPSGSTEYYVMTKFMINNRTDEYKTKINFLNRKQIYDKSVLQPV